MNNTTLYCGNGPFPNSYNKLPNKWTYQKDLKGHKGCVNAIAFSGTEDLILSGGDDRTVFLWRTSDVLLQDTPIAVKKMDARHLSNIFALEFNSDCNVAFSGGNDFQVYAHDCETGRTIQKYMAFCAVYDISAHPSNPYVFSCSNGNGTIDFYDIRDNTRGSVMKIELRSRLILSLTGDKVYSGRYNPAEYSLFCIATSGALQIHDLRYDINSDLFNGKLSQIVDKCAMFADWNSSGTALTVLESSDAPIYIDLIESEVVRLLDEKYRNDQTVKSAAFIGNDHIITGSDDFNLYVWNLNSACKKEITQKDSSFTKHIISSAEFTLQGHRSIVNNVCYSSASQLLISSGVEKIIKAWSPFNLPHSYDKPKLRRPGSFSAFALNNENDDEGEDMDTLLYFDSLLMNEGDLDEDEYDVPSESSTFSTDEGTSNEVSEEYSGSEDDDRSVPITHYPP